MEMYILFAQAKSPLALVDMVVISIFNWIWMGPKFQLQTGTKKWILMEDQHTSLSCLALTWSGQSGHTQTLSGFVDKTLGSLSIC